MDVLKIKAGAIAPATPFPPSPPLEDGRNCLWGTTICQTKREKERKGKSRLALLQYLCRWVLNYFCRSVT